MNKHKGKMLMAGAIAMAFAGGTVLAAGAMPYDGDGSGAGFTIDHALFDPSDVEGAPCPAGATCANGTATDGSGMLMREVALNGDRYYQQIIADLGGAEGDFVMEAAVTTSGENNNYASKIRIDQGIGANGFSTEMEFRRGAHFNGVLIPGNGANNFANTFFRVDQEVGGFQTFHMDSTGNPGGNQPNGGSGILNGTIHIVQDPGGSVIGHFVHVVKQGTAVPVPGNLTVDGLGSIGYLAGDRISATFVGMPMFNGGPTTTILAPGQVQDHNHRNADQVDFGVLMYRVGGQTGNGAAGGITTSEFGAQFSQGAPAQELRAFSLHPDQETGEMYNINHGAFVGGFDLLADNWDNNAIFGPSPF